MSENTAINIPVHLDETTFRRFAFFDTIRRQQRWRMPVWFMVIMLSFAVFLFLQTDKEQSALLGGVLAAIGLGLPVVYFISFSRALKTNVKQYHLPRLVYTLKLTDKEVYIHSSINKDEELTLPWEQLHAAYRVNGSVYLYVLPTRAFLLPDGQADQPEDALWAFVQTKLPAEHCRDLRKQ